MRILFAVLVSSAILSAAAQTPDPKQFPETVKIISETKQTIDAGSTTTTRRVSPVVPCDLNIPSCKGKLQSVTKSNVQSFYQVKAQIGDMLYTINGKSGGPGVPFGTFKARITNQYMDIYIVDKNGPYVLGFEIAGAEKVEAQASLPPAQQTSETRQDGVVQRGDHVMGFRHDSTTHHFHLLKDGGEIVVIANDPDDKASVSEIRIHLMHIAKLFSDGDFNAPMLIHDTNPPGVATMTRLKAQIPYELSETEHGAKIRIVTTSPETTDAVHAFLLFQIVDHQTGDVPTIGS
jgi:hypothetical protein